MVKAPVPWVVAPIVVKFPATGVVMPIVELLIVVPVIVPPEIAEEEEAKLLAVTNPVPKVTGRFVTVLIDKVEVAPVVSMTGLVEEIFVDTFLNSTIPVPVVKVFAPVIVVAPFKLIAPVPVENVLAPV